MTAQRETRISDASFQSKLDALPLIPTFVECHGDFASWNGARYQAVSARLALARMYARHTHECEINQPMIVKPSDITKTGIMLGREMVSCTCGLTDFLVKLDSEGL